MASRVVLPRLIFIISFALQALNVLSESAQPTRNQHRRALLEQQTTGAEKDDVSLSRVERLERLRQKRHHRRHHQGSTAATLAALRDDRWITYDLFLFLHLWAILTFMSTIGRRNEL